jgi:uncharacterized repeat protein (TIGR03806 family)
VKRPLLALVLALGLAACGGDEKKPAEEQPCTPGATFDPDSPPTKLSALCMLDPSPGAVTPREGVLPYDLNTPLFSDYAQKTRTVWLPPGTAAPYDTAGALDLPVGAIVTKTFAMAPDQRTPAAGRKLVETRVLVHWATGWRGYPYIWDADEQDATYTPGGRVRTFDLVTPSGTATTASYLIPSVTQCARCHSDDPAEPMHLLGPSVANLNRDFVYAGGTENQLAHWSAAGILDGAPAPAAAPKLAAAHDPASGTVEQRARAYLEVNCAFCHSTTGLARTTGLFLGTGVTDPFHLGVCKPPVAAGPGAGGLQYDVVPGTPDASILVHRVDATDAVTVMPQIGRSVKHEEGVALVREWVTGLSGGPCPD